MANVEQLVFDVLLRDRASDGLSRVGGAADRAAGNVDGLTRRLDEVGRKTATARLQLAGDKEAQAALDKIDAKLLSLDRRAANPSISLEGAARATAEISALDLELDKLGKKGGSADVATSAVGTGGLAGPGGMIALVGAGVALAPVIATVSVGLAGFGAAAYKTIAPILAAGTATKAQQEALAGLDPAQRAAYTSLGALKGQFGGFAKSLEPEALGLFSQGLKLAGGLLGDVQPVAAATGKALGVLVGDISADLKTSQWQNFFGFMARTAGPDIQMLDGLFINLMNALPPLLQDLQPVAAGMITLASGAAQAAGDVALLAGSLPNLQDKLNKALAPVEKSIPKGNENIFQVISDGVSWISKHVPEGNKTLLQLAQSTSGTASGTKAMGAAAATAAPQVGTLAGDLAILNSSTRTATDATKAFDDMWLQFVGKSVSDQQAVLSMAGAFDSYNTTLKTNKSNSTVAQQAFLSIITTMQSGLGTMQKQGDSVSTVNRFYQTNIDRLKALHGLTPVQRADVQGVIRDYDAWATSTGGLNGKLLTAADTVKNRFTANLKALGEFTPSVTGDIDRLSNSVLKTGTTSSATAGFRARLIADLKAAGVSGQVAAGYVDGLERKIAGLQGKTVQVGVHASGSGSITASESIPGGVAQKQLGHLVFFARGGRVTGGVPGRDSVLGLLMPDELVVPEGMVRAGEVDHLRGRLPGFAAGGMVGAVDFTGAQGGSFAAGEGSAFARGLVPAFQKAVAAAAAAAASAAGVGAGVARWTGVVDRALSMLGLPLSLAARVLYQMQTESGGNPRAINLSDFNATVLHDPSKGLMQVIGSTFRAFHVAGTSGDIYDPLANVAAALHYGELRYGPTLMTGGMGIGSGHGYDNGGFLPPGLSLAWNGTGVPEPVIPAGRGGGSTAGGTQVIIVKVDPVIAAVTPDRNLGRHIADHLTAHVKAGGRLYPAGTVPR